MRLVHNVPLRTLVENAQLTERAYVLTMHHSSVYLLHNRITNFLNLVSLGGTFPSRSLLDQWVFRYHSLPRRNEGFIAPVPKKVIMRSLLAIELLQP